MIDKKKQGKKNKQAGSAWELKVRKDLESKGWFVAKFQNNVEFGKTEDGNFIPIKWKDLTLANGEHYPSPNAKMIPAKRKYNMYSRAMTIGTGFPDFIAFKNIKDFYEVIGVEAKSNGYLDKEEKEKCRWLLKNKVFSKIIIAKKKKEGRKVVPEYIDFKERYKNE